MCKNLFWLFLFVVASLFSCKDHRSVEKEVIGKSMPLEYAENFRMEKIRGGYRVLLGQGNETSELLFIRKDSLDGYDAKRVITIPLQRVASTSGTHLNFIDQLDALSAVCATCDSTYLYNSKYIENIRSGRTKQLGSSFQLNNEVLLVSQPDVLLLSDEKEVPSRTICPAIVCKEWTEESALGRSEWIKFFGVLFDRVEMADSLFSEVEKEYQRLVQLASSIDEQPSVVAAGSWGDTWYLTGGKGYMAAMYKDANASYLLADTLVGTVTCGLEWVLSRCKEADFWMNCSVDCKESLDDRLSVLKAYKSDRVYHYNRTSKSAMGMTISAFYEETVARPEKLLAELIAVFHPQLKDAAMKNSDFRYIQQVR